MNWDFLSKSLTVDNFGQKPHSLGMHKRSRKRPTDINRLARGIVDETTNEDRIEPEKNPAAVALGRLGGLKGGKARAEALSPKKRSEIAKKAAQTRWKAKS